MKKLLAILLAVACCLSCAAFAVSADEAEIDLNGEDVKEFLVFNAYGEEFYTGFNHPEADAESYNENHATTVTTSEEGLTFNFESWTSGYYTPVLAPVDQETGDPLLTPNPTGYAYMTNSTDAGLAFYVDYSSASDDDTAITVRLIWQDLDFNDDGTPRKKQGTWQATTFEFLVTIEPGFEGVVNVPFSEMGFRWESEDHNGYVDLAANSYFMFYLNENGGVTVTDAELLIGNLYIYGADDNQEFVGQLETLPEDWVTIIDTSEIENDYYNEGLFTADPETQGTIESVDTGLKITASAGCTGWWFQKPVTFYSLDDETGDRTGNLPGFTGKLDKWYDATSDEAGLAFYVEGPAVDKAAGEYWADTDPVWWIGFYLQEKEMKEDGTVKLIQGKEATTTFSYLVTVPHNYKGWIKVPFSALTQDKWGETAQDIANEDGKFNAELISNMTFVASLYCGDKKDAQGAATGYEFLIGDVVVWGEGTSKTVDGGNDDDQTPDDGNDDENPDTGVTGVAGIASVAAVIALAAVVCFRKKD